MGEKFIVIQFIKFSLVGVLNTAIHYAVFFALFKFFGIYYLLASGIGYFTGLVNSFILNRKWTFQKGKDSDWSEFLKFLLVNFGSLLVNLFSLKYSVLLTGIRPEFGQLAAICLSTAANFLGNKFWTFRHVEKVAVR